MAINSNLCVGSIRGQRAISWSVREQPTQNPDLSSMRQMEMQGDGTSPGNIPAR
jgi:hypothetical protein